MDFINLFICFIILVSCFLLRCWCCFVCVMVVFVDFCCFVLICLEKCLDNLFVCEIEWLLFFESEMFFVLLFFEVILVLFCEL